MIERFFEQSNDSILEFLSEIGKDKGVFSCFSGMEIDGYTVFFYATKTEIVLLCMDYAMVEDGTVEFADKGLQSPIQGDAPKCFRRVMADGTVSNSEQDTRLSPVMQLYDHACMMRKFLALSQQFEIVPAIHLMLLTNSRISNLSDAIASWQQDQFGISVLHGLKGLKDAANGSLPTNRDLTMECSAYWTKWQKYLQNRGWFDWADPNFDDTPRPSVKRYSWKPSSPHLISDEFEEKES